MVSRSCRMVAVASVLIVAVVLTLAAENAAAQQISIPAGGVKLKPSHPKFSTALSQVLTRHEGMAPMDRIAKSGYGAFLENRHYLMSYDERLQVYIWMTDWEPESLDALRQAGVAWNVDDPEQLIVQSMVPVANLRNVADLDVVRAITLPNYVKFNVGFTNTSGDITHRSVDARDNYTLSGAGVKVGVLSDGLANGDGFLFPTDLFEACTNTIIVDTESDTYMFPDPNSCDLPPVIAPPFEADEPALDDCASLLFSVDNQPTTVSATFMGNITGHFGKIRYRSFIEEEALLAEIMEATEGMEFTPESDELQTYLIMAGSEGTAMLEVVHDIAPDAQLYFANFLTSVEFLQSKRWMVSQGVDIICDDISVFGEGPLDGTSPSSLLNANITRMGIDYVTPSGNYQKLHIRDRFADNPFQPTGVHNFRLPPSAAQLGDTTFDMILPEGFQYVITLVWQNDFANPVDDFDMFLLNSNFLDISQPLAFSVDFQGPAAQGLNAPVEHIFFDNTTGITDISLVITRKNQIPSSRPGPVFDVFFWSGFDFATFREPQFMDPLGSITNNNDAGGDVITVGAIDGQQATFDQIVLEPFSSFGTTWDNRKKPELTSVDRVAVSTMGFNPFTGTSAAPPHVAGALALLKELYPGITPAQGRSILMATAVDLFPGQSFPEYGIDDATGPDALSGAGLMDVLAAADFIVNLNNTSFAPVSRVYSFDTGTEGWVPQSLVNFGFNEPVFGVPPGGLSMAGGGSLSYGSWISPKIDFPGGRSALIGNAVYVLRANISTTASDNSFPSFRLRLSNFQNESVSERIFNSVDGNAIAPGALGRDYFVYFVPDSLGLAEGLFAAVDLMNFSDFDDVNATMTINEVEIQEIYTNVPEM